MGWQFWIDRGGTFTDIVAVAPDGVIQTRKLLSADPTRYADAAVHGIRTILNLSATEPMPKGLTATIKVGTTIATNALLERKGHPTVLMTTAGFGDALRIGTQHRPRIFDLNIVRPQPLYAHVIEVRERLRADGSVVQPLDLDHARQALVAAKAAGFDSLAIVLMHADRHPVHERALELLAREIGFGQISVSHRVNPVMKFVGRGDTTVADAYLSPLVRAYADRLSQDLGGQRLYFMQSNGGLAHATQFHGKDAVLSGPAGGVVGASETARMAGFPQVIGFDMGGTSTDVTHINGEPELAYETTVAGVRLRTPMMKLHTVAAGGGSICRFDGLQFRVGPESAGAQPGPACYRQGGPLTVTDCNVALGRISPDHFPRSFGPHRDQPIDRAAVDKIINRVTADIAQETGTQKTSAQVAENFLMIAVDHMARAIKRISLEQGHDVRTYALACFGGAGGQHACLVAEALNMNTVLIHPMAGVLSAFGIGLARQRTTRQRTVEQPLAPGTMATLDALIAQLASDASTALRADFSLMALTSRARVHLKLPGSDTALVVDYGPLDAMVVAFQKQFSTRFGFEPGPGPYICESVEVEVSDATPMQAPAQPLLSRDTIAQPIAVTRLISKGVAYQAPVLDRARLGSNTPITGPALIIEPNSTTVVDAGWSAQVLLDGHLVLRRIAAESRVAVSTTRDPALIEIFNNLFMSIAERMGAVLQSTARSVNIKERLDFSCAVFDGTGALIANAPHMPVHLGSMGESVKAVIAEHGTTMKQGDAYVLNAPYNGGTHLPDITVVAPVFVGNDPKPLFFTACRGHHSDIGGKTPGSMPSDSRTIADEGIVLDNLLIVRSGQFLEADIRRALALRPWPARNPDQNIADLKAQVAAATLGGVELTAACDRYGIDVVTAYMRHVLDHAEAAVRRAIKRLSPGEFTCPMDDGGVVKVAVSIDKNSGSAVVDFSGTSAQRPTNFNAPRAVCRAAVLYVFRTLIDEDIPLNDGCMRPIKLQIPPGSMLDPVSPAAVVAGNVETSQIICDALYGALGVLAGSQGTMNNFTFGNERHQYYETICGGAGAGPVFDGASAVQTHMTNSRLTDPEVLEWRYPVRLERFAIRRNSGGLGQHPGGDGVERTLEFQEAMSASILSGRRTTQPFGLYGGQPGSSGATLLQRASGQTIELAATATVDLQPGDRITILTPGGGGYGLADPTAIRSNHG